MAKISPTSIKYSIIADFVAEGPFQKPDVIGALFGQTEGLLGSDMELRELQKEGKIGRIEVDLKTEGGKTTGEIIIPSALDKTETTIIAAALETIDKIGPTDAKISIREIEDVRGSKRDYIMERAKALLSQIKNEGVDSTEMGSELRDSARVAKAVSFGTEDLTAGPDVESSSEIIVVEGRADVMNLLRCGIKNAIGMNGTRLPKAIAELGKTKALTLFIDGDRGGKLIAKNVYDNAKIAFIAVAPDGKEVEELTGKEVLQALRKKVSADMFIRRMGDTGSEDERLEEKAPSKRSLTDEDYSKLREMLKDVKGKNLLVLNDKLEVLKNISSFRLDLIRAGEAYVLLTLSATSGLISAAERLGVYAVAAKTFGKISDSTIELISL